MKPEASSRRRFLTASSATLAAAMVGNGSRLVAQPAPPPATRVRKDVGTLANDDPILVTYRAAVTAMRALPDSDAKSWNRQAQIHLDKCPHGNWFFVPWHRGYLYHFEEICRAVSGDANFALPYWNWTKDPQIPAAFWGDGNALNHPRDAGPDDTIEPELVGEEVINTILEFTDFEDFASLKSTKQRGGIGGGKRLLEYRPHDNVHGFIGGDMATYMSPLDPIFWLHHANIDRIWAKWNELGRANTSDPVWTDYVFQGDFVDATGAAQNLTVSKTSSTYGLNYRYDDQAPTPPPAPPVLALHPLVPVEDLTVAAANHEIAKPMAPISVSLPASQKLLAAASKIADEAAAVQMTASGPKARESTVRLRISNITPPKDKGAYVRVFINCPYLSEKTPINDPHYVTSFGFFGSDHGGHGHHGGADYVLDVTETLAKLSRRKSFPQDKIEVQLLAVSRKGDPGNAEVLAGKFEFGIASSKPQG